jgi:Domain of unknown function (DUF4279)
MRLEDISFEEEDNTKSIRVTYRIRSDIIVPETITSELGLQPSDSFIKGDKYLGKVRDPNTKVITSIGRVRPWGIWKIDSRGLDKSLKVEDHIVYLLEILEPRSNQIRKYLDNKLYVISFHIRRETLDSYSSFEISSNLLERMSRLCNYIEVVSR